MYRHRFDTEEGEHKAARFSLVTFEPFETVHITPYVAPATSVTMYGGGRPAVPRSVTVGNRDLMALLERRSENI